MERMQTPQCRVHCLLDSQGKKVRHSDESHEEYNIDNLTTVSNLRLNLKLFLWIKYEAIFKFISVWRLTFWKRKIPYDRYLWGINGRAYLQSWNWLQITKPRGYNPRVMGRWSAALWCDTCSLPALRSFLGAASLLLASPNLISLEKVVSNVEKWG